MSYGPQFARGARIVQAKLEGHDGAWPSGSVENMPQNAHKLRRKRLNDFAAACGRFFKLSFGSGFRTVPPGRVSFSCLITTPAKLPVPSWAGS